MAWEADGRYRRKVREGGKVRSVYVGGGLLGDLAALEDAQRQEAQRAQAQARRQERNAAAAVDAEYKALRTLVSAVLLTRGYHTHNRQWRRKRER